MIRNPAVAGQFYRGTKEALEREVAPLVGKVAAKEDAIGVVSPHAGYLYSGAVAGATLSSIKPKKTYVIIGPNHTGMGEPFGPLIGKHLSPLSDDRRPSVSAHPAGRITEGLLELLLRISHCQSQGLQVLTW